MGSALLILLGEAVLAFVSLDLLFRVIPVHPATLERSIKRYGICYALIAGVAVATGLAAQWLTGHAAGLVLGSTYWLPWWLLWRFGLRKQFPYRHQ